MKKPNVAISIFSLPAVDCKLCVNFLEEVLDDVVVANLLSGMLEWIQWNTRYMSPCFSDFL